MFRKTVTPGDPLRDWTLIWSLDAAWGNRPPLGVPAVLSPLAGGQAVTVPPLSIEKPPHLTNSVQAVRVPATLPAGDYALTVNGTAYGTLAVTPPRPPRPTVHLSAWATDADALEKALATSDVILDPGAYHFKRAVRLPAGSSLEGYGAVLIREADGDYGERLFIGGQDCTLRGLTLRPLYLAVHADPPVTGLVLQDVTLKSGILGYGPSEALLVDCLFDGGYAMMAPTGLYLRCRFVGGVPGLHALSFTWGCVNGLALVDCDMDRTDRGPVFQTTGGSFTDNLILNLRCSHIAGADNGSEIILAEGDPAFEFSRNLIVFVSLHACNSSVYQLDTTARDNLLWGLSSDGPCCVRWSGWGCEVTGNVLMNFELRGGHVQIGSRDSSGHLASGRVKGNTIRDGAFVGPPVRTRANQPAYQPGFYQPMPYIVTFDAAEAESNRVFNVSADAAAVPGVARPFGDVTQGEAVTVTQPPARAAA